MEYPVQYERRVRFSDSDVQGIVFNGNYFTYFDDTITDYFDALGIVWSELNERGYDMVLGRAEIDFRSVGRIGETLITGARVVQIGTSSMVFELHTWEKESGRTVVRGKEIQVMLDHATFEKTVVPDWLIEAVERLQGGPVPRKGAS
ncbi:acyl-CoA thioesterase [Thermodesulfobacteriota bacterium]